MASQPGFAAPVTLAARTAFTTPLTQPAARPVRPHAVSRRTAPQMAFSSIEGVLTEGSTALPSDIGTVIKAVYKQVLGNAHFMESERAELAMAESTFIRTGDIREFVRAIAQSDAYKSRFFYPVSQYRFVELAFKHLLGRAASSRMEYAQVMGKYHNEGYDACIAWFVDSEEYEENFGSFIVPYGIYKGCYATNELFNRSVAMRLAPGASDKGRSAMLQYCVLSGDSPSWLSISKALPAGTEKGTGFTIGGHWQSSQRNKNAPVRKGTKIPGGVVFY